MYDGSNADGTEMIAKQCSGRHGLVVGGVFGGFSVMYDSKWHAQRTHGGSDQTKSRQKALHTAKTNYNETGLIP